MRFPTVDVMFFAGSASRRLGEAIAARLGVRLGESEVIRFSEDNLFVRVLENVRGRDVFIVQGTAFPANDNFMDRWFKQEILPLLATSPAVFELVSRDQVRSIGRAGR